ncbi:MAG TPA: right-handed parallel beta-helix repeat-containing protein, partial [bacterium]|nr:right-handed parallel beta-helix repeat-containing protein [bacterium]
SSDIVLGPNLLDRNPDYSYGDGGDSKNAVVVRNSYNLTMTGLHISHVIGMPAGLVLNGCRNYNLTNSTILNCEEGGILLRDSEHGSISDNLISDDRARSEMPPAIRVQGGQHNHVSSNFVDGDIEVDPNSAELSDNYTP